MNKRILAAKKTCAFIFGLGLYVASSTVSYSGIPVIDGANLSQTVITAINQVAQALKQIDQYKTQLDQYQNQLKNTLVPSTYLWDDAQTTMNNLVAAVDTLEYYKTRLGSLTNYLDKTHDETYWKASPCFTAAGCSAAQQAALDSSIALGSESQKKANDNAFKGLETQQQAMKNDAARLAALQSGAQSATGQLEAIQFASQIASHQSNQLLQIRGLLVAQQNSIITRNQALMNKEAIDEATEAAHSAQVLGNKYNYPSPASPPKTY